LLNGILLLAMAIFILSCSKKPIRESAVVNPPPPPGTYDNGVFVVNEGNFNWGNASVSFINLDNNTVSADLFEPVNHRKLGDVAQNMSTTQELGYIVVNNSNKIEIVSLEDFSSVKSLTGFNSPRSITFVDNNKAYVTNLLGDINVLNTTSMEVKDVIKTSCWTEQMVKFGNLMFVAAIGKYNDPNYLRNARVLIINTLTDQIIDSIKTGKEPLGMVIDKKDKIWVLCSGGYDNFEAPSLLRIDPLLLSIEKTFHFPDVKDIPSRLCINGTLDTLYFLKDGIFQMPVTATAIPDLPLVASEGRLFYGLGVNPSTGDIFVSDAVDYVQNGWAYQFSSATGELLHSYQVGRIPGSFCFSKASSKK
jgi:hypothetical protein